MVERVLVWTGGGLFVASLAVCASSYLVGFGRRRPWHGWQPLVADVVLFTVFAAHHSVFRGTGHKLSGNRSLRRPVSSWPASG